MTEINQILFSNYKYDARRFGIDLDGDHQISPHEKVDLNEDGTTTTEECLSFIERNAALIRREVMQQIIEAADEAARTRLQEIYTVSPSPEELTVLQEIIDQGFVYNPDRFLAPWNCQALPDGQVEFIQDFLARYPSVKYALFLQLVLVAGRLQGKSKIAHAINIMTGHILLGQYLSAAYNNLKSIPLSSLSNLPTNPFSDGDDLSPELLPPGATATPEMLRTIFIDSYPVLFFDIVSRRDQILQGRVADGNILALEEGQELVADYQSILDAFPQFSQNDAVRLRLAEIYRLNGMEAKAQTYLLAILPTAKKYGSAQFALGEMFLKSGQTKKAVACFENVAYGLSGVSDQLSTEDRKLYLEVHGRLSEYYLKQGDPTRAFEHYFAVVKIGAVSSYSDKYYEDKFKLAYLAMLVAVADKNDAAARSSFVQTYAMPPRDFAIKTLEEMIEQGRQQHSGSPFAPRAIYLRDAISEPKFNLDLKMAGSGGGIVIKKLGGIDGLSLVFVGGSLFPEVMPGNAVVGAGGTQVVVDKYFGKFRVVFMKPQKTIPANNDALLLAWRKLPNEFFEKFKLMSFFGETRKDRAGDYASDVIRVFENGSSFGTIVHELAHHWDLAVALGSNGRDVLDDSSSFGDLSQIYYDISWDADRISREIDGADYGVVSWDRHDFENGDFADDYGKCNRREDLASMAEEYVAAGDALRQTIARQMRTGQFELAAKYLFVKYLMPFRGTTEFGYFEDYVDDSDDYQPLTFEIVEKALAKWLKDNPNSVPQATQDAIKKIKEKYREIENK